MSYHYYPLSLLGIIDTGGGGGVLGVGGVGISGGGDGGDGAIGIGVGGDGSGGGGTVFHLVPVLPLSGTLRSTCAIYTICCRPYNITHTWRGVRFTYLH